MTSDLNKWHYLEDENIYITPKGRSSFVALVRKFKGKKTKKDDDGKYAVEISFPTTVDHKLGKKAANEALQEKFGNKVDFWVPGKSKGYNNPFLKAEEKLAEITSKGDPVDLDGWLMLRTSGYQRRPVVRDSRGNEIDLDDLDVEAYSGRWMRLMLRPKGYENEGKGVTFYLEGVQLLSHDDKIGGGAQATTGEGFGAVDDDNDEDDV
jgi:hypothetical protein